LSHRPGRIRTAVGGVAVRLPLTDITGLEKRFLLQDVERGWADGPIASLGYRPHMLKNADHGLDKRVLRAWQLDDETIGPPT
jgi:hypothetical protein